MLRPDDFFEVATGGRLKRLIELFVNSDERAVRLQTALQRVITESGERAVSILLEALGPFASLDLARKRHAQTPPRTSAVSWRSSRGSTCS